MPITFRQMTEIEFGLFCQWSIEHHTKELMKEQCIPEAEAMQAAMQEFTAMLSDGLHTENNDLMTITETESEEVAGFIWTLYEENNGRKQSFVCDFAVWESKRRKGYGTMALHLAEKQAAEAGCLESVLFVDDDNIAAIGLYRKCGYTVLRQKGRGKYMIKQLLRN